MERLRWSGNASDLPAFQEFVGNAFGGTWMQDPTKIMALVHLGRHSFPSPILPGDTVERDGYGLIHRVVFR